MKTEIEKSIPEKIFDEMVSLLREDGNIVESQIIKLKALFENNEFSKDKPVLEILTGEVNDEID